MKFDAVFKLLIILTLLCDIVHCTCEFRTNINEKVTARWMVQNNIMGQLTLPNSTGDEYTEGNECR